MLYKKNHVLACLLQANLFLYLLIFCVSCQTTEKKTGKAGEAGKEIPAPIKLQYAQNFTVRYFTTHKEITLKSGKKYALIPRGKTAPKGFANEEIIEIPVRSCVMTSHTHIACLQLLDLRETLVGLTEAAYLPDKPFLEKLKQNQIHEVGKDGVWQNELLFAIKPDLVMLSGMGDDSKMTLPAHTRKVVNMDWQESHPLGRLEWLYFVSLFFEREHIAKKFCEAKIKLYEAKVQKNKTTKKKIIFDVPYKGTWYMPAGNSYMATLLRDAGGEYAWAHTTGTASLPLDFEAVYAEAQKADIWLNVGACRNLSDIVAIDSRLATIPALRAGKVYSYQKQTWTNGANPYFMQSILQPDAMLEDLISILHPDYSDRENVYYTQLK